MNTRVLLSAIGLAGAAILFGQLDVGAFSGADTKAVPGPGTGAEAAGEFLPTAGGSPDVYALYVSGLANWSQGEYRAYSVGTTSCNQGDTPLEWHPNDNQHPVIGQNMFRYRIDAKGHGRFEQIGQGWLKHGFCALDQNGCGDCEGTGCISLGVNCSDPYTATRNGTQGSAGPKYEVNSTTGYFPYPPANPAWSGSMDRRLNVHISLVDPDLNADALYYFEAQYVHPQDNPASTAYGAYSNNASYRKVLLGDDGVATEYDGETIVKKPAILAWDAIDPEVAIQRIIINGEGVMRVAYRAYDNGDGTWDYEYAVHNLDVDRGVGAFTVPVPESVTVTDIGFNGVEYHSGEIYSNTPWSSARVAGELRWETESFSTNANASAIRWGNMFNFRFTADGPPAIIAQGGRLDVFKPGTPDFKSFSILAPVVPVVCNGDADGDLVIGFQDLVALLHDWGPCPGCPSDIDEDGEVGFEDLLALMAAWGPCN